MPHSRWLAVALILLAGCSGPSEKGSPLPEMDICQQLAIDGDCIDIYNVQIELTACQQSRAVIDLTSIVYDLPRGYSNAATATSPQRLSVSVSHCASALAGNASWTEVSFVHVGVLVNAGERDQSDGVDSFDIETTTNVPALAAMLRAAGFEVANGTAFIVDAMATREAIVEGEVEYLVEAQFVPLGNGPIFVGNDIPGGLPHHSILAWYQEKRVCSQYFGTAAVQISAQRGALERAMPTVGPLAGTSSQAISCDTSIAFRQF
jgi:hypothetical protein